MSPQMCRVPGCVAFAEMPRGAVDVLYATGICVGHQQLCAEDLRIALAREIGMVGQLRRIDVRIGYQRADGSQYMVDDDGRCVETRPAAACQRGAR